MKDFRIFSVIPAYNAEKTIRSVIFDLKTSIPQICVIVVDDCSTDATRDKVNDLNILCIEHPQNLGKGAALRSGFKAAVIKGADYILTLDADGQHNPAEAYKLISKAIAHNFDVLIGTRIHNRSKMPIHRVLSNAITSELISARVRQKIEDSQSGYRVYRSNLFEEIELVSNRFELESEIIIKAALKGYKIGFADIQTIYSTNGKSEMRVVDIFRFMRLYLSSFFW